MPYYNPARYKNNKGFTLVELLVVIAVLGLLSSIILVALNDARTKGRDAKRIADMNQVAKALDFYYDKYGRYPIANNTNLSTNWQNMINILKTEKFLAEGFGKQKKSFLGLIPLAHAAAVIIQDPQYPAKSYGYMSNGEVPIGSSYRLRVHIEDLSNPALKYGLPGRFLTNANTTGPNACDASLGYYCIGPPASNLNNVFYPAGL